MKAHAEASELPSGSVASAKDAREGRRKSRKEYTRQLALELAALARERRIEDLALCLSGLPRWAGLAVRERFIEGGDCPALEDALLQGLEHPRSSVRYVCAHALDHFGDDRCAEPLRRLLHDPAPRVRRVALHSLGCQDCKLTPLQTTIDFPALATEQALNDPSINVRRHAAAALGLCGNDPRALDALNTLLDGETDIAILRNARFALRSR